MPGLIPLGKIIYTHLPLFVNMLKGLFFKDHIFIVRDVFNVDNVVVITV